MRVSAKITGVEECCSILRRVPEKADKLITKGMREASKPILKEIRSATPHKSWKKIAKIKVYKTDIGRAVRVGLFHKKGTWEWFKAYWANYGTLLRRDQSHTFQNPIRRNKTKRRNNMGQPAQNFYDRAIEGAQEGFMRRFNDYLVDNESKLI